MTVKQFAEKAVSSLSRDYDLIAEGRVYGTEDVTRLQRISEYFTRCVPGRERGVVVLLKATFCGVYEALKLTVDETEAVAAVPPQNHWRWFRKERVG